MHLTNYDYHDLYRLLCHFRAWPEQLPDMCGAVSGMLALLSSPEDGCAGPNALRRIWAPFVPADDPFLSWVRVENDYSADVEILRKPQAYAVAGAILQELLNSASDPARVYLLCDSTHNIPLILADPGRHHMPYRDMLSDYRSRYSPSFLKAELRRL